MNFDQSEEDNRKEFIERLVSVGWLRSEAEEEWERVQEEEE